MSKVTDFYGILSLNRVLLDELNVYLEQKEADLGEKLLSTLLKNDQFQAVFFELPTLDLSTAIYYLCEHPLDMAIFDKINHDVREEKIRKINSLFWDYAEVLEESSLELFQRFKLIGIDKWNGELFRVVESIKELLLYHIQNLSWSIQKLEKALVESDLSVSKRGWIFKFLKKPFTKILDRHLLYNLKKTDSYLRKHHKKLSQISVNFFQTVEKIEEGASKFKDYHGFGSLDPETKSKFFTLYRLTKLWEANLKLQMLTREEMAKAYREYTPADKALHVLKNYFLELKRALFTISREWKNNRDASVKDKLFSLKCELMTLGAIVTQFREMVLNINPDPYVRTKLGFGEWIVGPEPRKAKDLLELVYEIERFDHFYKDLIEKVSEGPVYNIGEKRRKVEAEIEKVLHEMGQPLASRSLIEKGSIRLISLLESCDELGGTLGENSRFFRKVLIRALRYDWKYQVLPDNNRFLNLLTVHVGLSQLNFSAIHDKRMRHYREITHRIQIWVEQKNAFKHLREIETDISDVKESLQDFLASSRNQLEVAEENQIYKKSIEEEISFFLLEYRIIFAGFFAFLRKYGVDGRLVRSQFLFADHYFEAVELLL